MMPIQLSELEKQKHLLKLNQKQRKNMKRTSISRKIRDGLFSNMPDLALLRNDSSHGRRRLSCTSNTSNTSSQSIPVPFRRSRSASNIAPHEAWYEEELSKLEQELFQYKEMHEQMLQDAAESVEETEYLQSELEVTCQKLHASLIETHDLNLKLQKCTEKLSATEQQLRAAQDVLKKLLDRRARGKESNDHNPREIAKEMMHPWPNGQITSKFPFQDKGNIFSVSTAIMDTFSSMAERRFSGGERRSLAIIVCMVFFGLLMC